ncbi:hypothetical protein [Halococcus saccharolyticus]|uniref:Uncharacterized protein n=1 Tax=Halococcus saccharolyticus DSM 5350 TaxID=1227455 RepID=M0MA55_9EURY|nr:hypothetical protein [Halococcus saccharolyticus]EMA42672.1 hypothetical protein C449_16058 [Halococcus saccharolyticus DSM 5350]
MAFSRERRAHIARKLHFLDGWSAEAIADHFEEEGIADIKPRTVRKYFKDSDAEETIEKVRDRMAEEDLRIAESLQRKHDRAREAEANADKEVPIQRVFPETEQVRRDRVSDFEWTEWEQIEPGDADWPEWATPGRDVLIRFTGRTTIVQPGERYPIKGIDGEPKYTTEFVGLEEVRNEKARAFRREEQAEHLEKKAQVLGIEDNELDVNVGGSIDLEHSVPEEIVTAVVGASHNRLDNDADGSESTDSNKQPGEADNGS